MESNFSGRMTFKNGQSFVQNKEISNSRKVGLRPKEINNINVTNHFYDVNIIKRDVNIPKYTPQPPIEDTLKMKSQH